MIRKFKVTLTRGPVSAVYLISYFRSERPDSVDSSGSESEFVRQDGSPVTFNDVHIDQLAAAVKEHAEKNEAVGVIDEVTGQREFQIKLEGEGFRADYIVIYHPGNAVPFVKSSSGNPENRLPDGTVIPFAQLRAEDLKTFVGSTAKSNGLNFDFRDLDE
ncbi:MAG: hypothetical protein ABI162_08380 [Luteolibacter sp.]